MNTNLVQARTTTMPFSLVQLLVLLAIFLGVGCATMPPPKASRPSGEIFARHAMPLRASMAPPEPRILPRVEALSPPQADTDHAASHTAPPAPEPLASEPLESKLQETEKRVEAITPPTVITREPELQEPEAQEMEQPLDATAPPTLTKTNSDPAMQTAIPDYRIGSRDVLQITLFNIPEENGVVPRTTEVRVNEKGLINLPLLEEVPAAGLTSAELEQKLWKQYEEYIYDPQVRVLVKEYHSQRILVTGAVQKPGMYELSSPTTVLDVLALAGGVRLDAGNQVHLHRQGPEGRQSYVIDIETMARNADAARLPLQTGDVLNVPVAGMFYVDGAVGRPGTYALDHQPYTLTEALVVAGGVEKSPAKRSQIAIFRRDHGGDFDKITVDLDKIRAGEMKDVRLQADDMILVPTSVVQLVVNRLLGAVGIGVSAPLGGAGAGLSGAAGR